jgi:hypothetical protein
LDRRQEADIKSKTEEINQAWRNLDKVIAASYNAGD